MEWEGLLEKWNWETQKQIPLTQLSCQPLKAWLEKNLPSLPEKPSFHITGSIGKGSTLLILEALFSHFHWKTGTYLSPHLIHPRERIRIQGKPLIEEDFQNYLQKILPTASGLTYFETLTAMAFQNFLDQKVDICFYEVGIGGRRDSTNLNPSHICLFTSILDEHMAFFGKNLEDIGREKAGIIKGTTQVALSMAQKPCVLKVIEEECEKWDIPLYLEGRDFGWQKKQKEGILFWKGQELSFPLPFPHEIHLANTGLALAGALAFGEWMERRKEKQGIKGKALPSLSLFKKDSLSFLENLSFPGRCEEMDGFYILDVAHHPASFEALFKALHSHYPHQKWGAFFSIYADKKVKEILEWIEPKLQWMAFFDAFSPRSIPKEDLKALVKDSGKILDFPSLESALDWAERYWKNEGMVLIAGSHSLVGKAKSLLQ